MNLQPRHAGPSERTAPVAGELVRGEILFEAAPWGDCRALNLRTGERLWSHWSYARVFHVAPYAGRRYAALALGCIWSDAQGERVVVIEQTEKETRLVCRSGRDGRELWSEEIPERVLDPSEAPLTDQAGWLVEDSDAIVLVSDLHLDLVECDLNQERANPTFRREINLTRFHAETGQILWSGQGPTTLVPPIRRSTFLGWGFGVASIGRIQWQSGEYVSVVQLPPNAVAA